MAHPFIPKRVVVTGLGVISPSGLNSAETWAGLVAGRCGIGPVTQFDASEMPSRLCGAVKGFDPASVMDFKEARRLGAHTQYAVAALTEARHNAGLDMAAEDPTRVGVCLGSALGGASLIESQAITMQTGGVRRVNPALLPATLSNMPACYIALTLGAKGPCHAPTGACATGALAIGDGYRSIQRGEVDVMVAGAADAPISPLGFAGFGRLGALSARNDDPQNACRPFDAQRDGTIVSEGAAVLVLESLEHAQRRGATILAELVGYGLTEDAYHLVAPDPDGAGAARAMRLALQEADWTPADVQYICAHGTGTPLNDAAETKAIKLALGEYAYKAAISSNKAVVGHMMGAASAFSAFATVKTIAEGVIPPTANLRNPDPQCDLDYVPLQSRPADVRRALVNGFGFGGQNGSLAFQRFEG